MGVDGDRPQHTTEARSNILYIPYSSFNRTLPPDHLHTRTAPCSYCATVDRRLCCAGANARASRRVPGPGGCRPSFGSRHKHLECNVATISLAVSVGSSGSRLMTIGRGLRSRTRPQTCRSAAWVSLLDDRGCVVECCASDVMRRRRWGTTSAEDVIARSIVRSIWPGFYGVLSLPYSG